MSTDDYELHIGDLAALAGVSPRNLRYYEQQGLLTPRRLSNGYRVYSPRDAETVRRIRFLLRAGIPTRVMSRVLACVDGEAPRLTVRCADAARVIEEHRRFLDADIAALSRSRGLLDRLLPADSEQLAG
jgi:DNA-binding transcriptional MerR regulator